MKIKVNSGELNRIMKILGKCLDTKTLTKATIKVSHESDRLTIQSTNGTFFGSASILVPGGDGETFYIDGSMFSKVINLCSGEIDLSTDERCCIVKGTGRTRIPFVSIRLPDFKPVKGKYTAMKAEDFKTCYKSVAYAVATDQSRPILTGILTETDGRIMRMIALDGYQMAIESTKCSAGESIEAVIPGAFMEWINNVAEPGEDLKMITDGKRIQAETAGVILQSALMKGEYIDYKRLQPETFATETLVKVATLRNALQAGSIVGSRLKLMKIHVDENSMTILSNSEEADYQAEISCQTQGEPIRIAFNERYIMNTMNAIDAEDAVMKFNTPTSPIVVQGKNKDGIHFCLPVRIHEVAENE